MLLLDVRLSEAKSLFGGSPIEQSLPLLRYSHEGVSLRGHAISDVGSQFHHGVAHDPRTGVMQFEVQVGACGMPCIATDGNEVARLDRQLFLGIAKVQRVAPARSLEQLFIGFRKALQVAVDAGQPIRMVDIDGIAKAKLVDGDAADISFRNGKHLLALYVARLDVQATMEVPGSRFTKVSRQHDVIVDGRDIFHHLSVDN